ncbi:hypothetical protein BGZ70_004399 [Mortierella alpina]|uniref:BZIP domain-containing protein n=1 Tax=Mortierella alpina TaxID=64518 RepID=A0A9P6JA27_MORAP|nr:hypothetical protein BGZ70_004399 [Mortierella alpina]
MTLPEAVETPEEIAIRRAEQNRAAQRAFRQRKQKYIKWLESKAEELDEVYRIMALVRAENQQLCHVVAELEEKLSAAKGTFSSISASPLSTRSGPSTDCAIKAKGDAGVSCGNRGYTVDGSLGSEISMRLMNLAMLPSLGGPNSLDQDATLMSRSRSLSSLQDSSNNGVHNTKGKMAFKMSQQTKQQGTLLQTALQPSQLFFSQYQDRHHNSKQQQQQQQQHLLSSGDMTDQPEDQPTGQENGESWMSYSPSSASASSSSMLVLNTSTPAPGSSCLPRVSAAASVLLSPQSNHDDPSPSASVAHDYIIDAAQGHQQIQALPNSNELNGIAQNNHMISPLVFTQHSNTDIAQPTAHPTGSNATSPTQNAHTPIQARNKQFSAYHHPYAYTTFNNHYQHPAQPPRGAQPHHPQSSSSMDTHMQQQVGSLQWDDDDGGESDIGRGRRSSMPILHLSMPFSSAGAYDPGALTTGTVDGVDRQGVSQSEVQFRLQQQHPHQYQQHLQHQQQLHQYQPKQELYEVPFSALDAHLVQGHSHSLKQLSAEQQQQYQHRQQQQVIYGL